MLAAITDPLTVALGGAKPLPNQASQWQGWCVTDLRTDGQWRRGSFVVNGDGLGSDEVALSYACEYEGQATQGAAVRSRAQLLRLHATLVHDAPGSLVPPLTLENEQGVDAFAQGLLRHGRLRRCRAAVAFLVDLEGFEKIASELLELGEEVAPLGPRLALHEATRDKHANIDADETAAVIADILEWRRGQDDALLEAKRRVEVLQRSEGDLSTAWKGGADVAVLGRRAEGDLGAEPERARRRGAAAGADLRAASLTSKPLRGDAAGFGRRAGPPQVRGARGAAVDRLRRRGLLMRQRRERAHASYTARKTKLEAAERADEAAAEIEVPEDDVPDPERSTLSLALSAVALRAQAQYHSLGVGSGHRDRPCGKIGAFVLNRRGRSTRRLRLRTHWTTQFDVTEARKGFASEVAAFLDRFNVVRAAVLARLLEASAEHAERRRRASQEVLDDFRGSIGERSPPASPSRIAVEAPSRRAAERRAAAGTVMRRRFAFYIAN